MCQSCAPGDVWAHEPLRGRAASIRHAAANPASEALTCARPPSPLALPQPPTRTSPPPGGSAEDGQLWWVAAGVTEEDLEGELGSG